jgi:hypothetical protein
MKRAWVAIVAAAMLVGCRNSQPTTDPFLRTTVPPPGTGQGAVVVPGEQYYPTGAQPVPQAVTPFNPQAAPPPVVSPAVPVGQPVGPPVGPPPVAIPPRDKFSPPGGSYQYNQSSLDRPKSPSDSAGAVVAASYVEPSGNDATGPVNETDEGSSADATYRVTAGDPPEPKATESEATIREVHRIAIDEGTPRSLAPPRGSDPAVQVSGYAYAADYGSLRGRLEYSQSARQWKLRYIPIDGRTDSFGGSVMLGGSPALQAFKPGDMVAIRGSLAATASQSGVYSPLYRLDSIEPVAR